MILLYFFFKSYLYTKRNVIFKQNLMKKTILITLFFIFISSFSSVSAFSQMQTKLVYNNFVKKVEMKYDLESEVTIFEILDREL